MNASIAIGMSVFPCVLSTPFIQMPEFLKKARSGLGENDGFSLMSDDRFAEKAGPLEGSIILEEARQREERKLGTALGRSIQCGSLSTRAT